jgi:hypothetical protein
MKEKTLKKLEKDLKDHLKYNIYPPIKEILVPICIKAIEDAKNKKWDKIVENIKEKMTVGELIEDLHLEFFVESKLE